ncbi:MAG TPA: hypothetical protein V6C76_03665 [Drouetiella sp.]
MTPERPAAESLPPLTLDARDATVMGDSTHQADQLDATRAQTWGPFSAPSFIPALARMEPTTGSLDMQSGAIVNDNQSNQNAIPTDTAVNDNQQNQNAIPTDASGATPSDLNAIMPDTPDPASDEPAAVAKRAQDFQATLQRLGVDRSAVSGVDASGNPLQPRDAKDVTNIVVREGHKDGDPKPNFIIDKDGHIHEVQDPNGAPGGGGGGSMVIEIEPDAEGKVAVQNQRTAAQAMIEAIRANWTNSHVGPDIPDDLVAAANAADPPPVMRSRPAGGGGGGSVIGGSGGGAARGFSGGGMAGAGGPERHMRHEPHVGSDGHLQTKLPQDSPLFKALDQSKLTDRIIAATGGLESGGKFNVINHNDAGHGWSVGIRQWNQQAGELPTLIQAMYDRNPEKFNQDFGQFAGKLIKNGHVDENFVRHTNFNSLGKGFEDGMKQALSDFQDVQVALARQWAQSGIDLAQKYGFKSELGCAEVADSVNQYGYGGTESRLRRLGGGGEEQRIAQLDRNMGYQRGGRLRVLASKFSASDTAEA